MSSSPALDRWRAELQRGERIPTAFDSVWRSACLEAAALEADGDGLHALAERLRAEARRLLGEAPASTPAATVDRARSHPLVGSWERFPR